ncbi:hypothetical protein HHJ49_00015 [Escherichia coli]|nr:hypothetical protein HHJ49_00015 [Escherichia coli]
MVILTNNAVAANVNKIFHRRGTKPALAGAGCIQSSFVFLSLPGDVPKIFTAAAAEQFHRSPENGVVSKQDRSFRHGVAKLTFNHFH